MAAATNVAVVQGLQQNGVEMKASDARDGVRPGLPRLARGAELPVERVILHRLQAGRAQDAGDQEVPGRPQEVRQLHRRARTSASTTATSSPTSLIKGLESSRQDADPSGLHRRRPRGRACTTRPASAASRSTWASRGGASRRRRRCGYVLQVKGGKFVPFPKSGKPIIGKLVGDPRGHQAASCGRYDARRRRRRQRRRHRERHDGRHPRDARRAVHAGAGSPRRCRRGSPGVEVTDVIPGPIVERVSTNARFRIECEPEVPAGLSPALCAKGYFSEAGRGQRAGRRARGVLLPRPRRRQRRAHAQGRVGRRRSATRSTAS